MWGCDGEEAVIDADIRLPEAFHRFQPYSYREIPRLYRLIVVSELCSSSNDLKNSIFSTV